MSGQTLRHAPVDDDPARFEKLQKFHRTPRGLVKDAEAELGLTDKSLWLLLHLVVRCKRFEWPDKNTTTAARVRETDLQPLLAQGWVERRFTQARPGGENGSVIEITDAGRVVTSSLVMWLRKTSEGGALKS